MNDCSVRPCGLPSRGVVVDPVKGGRIIVLWGDSARMMRLPAREVHRISDPLCRWHLLDSAECYLASATKAT